MTAFNHRKDDIAAIYDAYGDMLYRIALSHLQNIEDAMDAVQDVFVTFSETYRSFSDDEHLKAWLIRVTVNRCNDLIRRRNVRRYIPIEELCGAAEEIVESDTAAGVLENLGKIPIKNRTVIILHYLEGYSVEETAKMLNISVSAVKMRLKRGREALIELIGGV